MIVYNRETVRMVNFALYTVTHGCKRRLRTSVTRYVISLRTGLTAGLPVISQLMIGTENAGIYIVVLGHSRFHWLKWARVVLILSLFSSRGMHAGYMFCFR